MARISWGSPGARRYETGVDRGVLYPKTGPGVSWTGLLAFNETPSGGDAKAYYMDGVKFQNRPASEEFSGTIEAYTYPSEFSKCDGTSAIATGLFAGQQPRQRFGLSYRTKVGNDLDGQDYGYKIHLIYNALAAPSDRSNQSLKDSPEVITFSWAVTTTPVLMAGIRPTAHIVIDSTATNSSVLSAIEDILYGSELNAARMPSQYELIALFTEEPSSVGIIVTDNGDGTFTVTGPDSMVRMLDATTFQITSDSTVDNGDGTFTTATS